MTSTTSSAPGRAPTETERAIASDEAQVRSVITGEVLREMGLAPLVVVRTYGSGVHIGRLVWLNGQNAELAESRRLWSWEGANTLSEVALHGVAESSRLAEPVQTLLTSVTEILPVYPPAVPSLTRSRWP